MKNLVAESDSICLSGFAILEQVYDMTEIDSILSIIAKYRESDPSLPKSKELFAVRQLLQELPELGCILFNSTLKNIIRDIFGEGYFLVKSIYFDKPSTANWFVAYHQDLTISLEQKLETEGFGPWTDKHNHYAVQAPLNILNDNFTVRIHLDDTNEANGALRVIPGSHLKGIYRPDTIHLQKESEILCAVTKAGIMVMKPLLMHSSGRSINNLPRRVIHMEFSGSILPGTLSWSEKLEFASLDQ